MLRVLLETVRGEIRSAEHVLALEPESPEGLPIELSFDEQTVTARLGPWTQPWERDDEGWEEVLDLVAAAVTGRLCIDERYAKGTLVGFDVCFGVQDDHRVVERVRRGRTLPWTKVQTRRRSNAGELPAPWRLGPPGPLPRAPWLGGWTREDANDAREVPIDGELDLHTFSPKQVADVVRAYVDEAHRRGVTRLRIVHGKGIGNLRRTVHALLAKHPAVRSHRLGGHGEGSWGATIVELHPPSGG